MMLQPTHQDLFLQDLGAGLVLRRSTSADAQALSEFNARIHSDDGPESPDERVGVWTLDLLRRPHPTFGPQDFTIVEDTQSGKIVSSMNLISQTWNYAGIEFKVGRPELVGTLPEYRNRGLVRAQFDVVHRWSDERGEVVQAITGIPYYYRQFGYEMALNLGGGRMGYTVNVPKLKEGEVEAYTLRPANETDVEFIDRLYRLGCQRSLVSCVWDPALWRYELAGKSPANVNRYDLRIILNQQSQAVGFLAHPDHNWMAGAALMAIAFELDQGLSWAAVTPSVVRYLQTTGEGNAARDAKGPWGAFGFWLGEKHPVYDIMHDRLPRVRKPYAWYVRVPDLPAFLRRLAPVLEERLARSPVAGHSAEMRVSFYRTGLKFTLENGKIQSVDEWAPAPVGHAGEAAFPGHTFLQILFGYRSLDELSAAFPDCWWENDDTYSLLNALFPRQASDIWAVS
jgi:hypothetical protein